MAATVHVKPEIPPKIAAKPHNAATKTKTAHTDKKYTQNDVSNIIFVSVVTLNIPVIRIARYTRTASHAEKLQES